MNLLGILIGPHSRGSNMLALARACSEGEIPGRVGIVIAPRDDAPGYGVATEENLKAVVIAPGEAYGDRLVAALAGCDLVCLAGYLRLLPQEVLEAYPDRVLNIHPALLPKFGGRGMYGIKVHEAVIRAGEKESGCTVHLVNARYDEGKILLQKRVPVLETDTPETLAQRVLKMEHEAYVEAVKAFLAKSIDPGPSGSKA
jgi:phosphoribosylglycinamide formyltransferase 1